MPSWLSINVAGDGVDWDHVARPDRAELGACGAAPPAGSWRSMSDRSRTRRRWINLGEMIALAALVVSAAGVWIAWKSSNQDKPTRVVEQRSTVPLALRGTAEGDGRTLTIMPGRADRTRSNRLNRDDRSGPIRGLGSDGNAPASDVAGAEELATRKPKDVTSRVPVRDRCALRRNGRRAQRRRQPTCLRYKWEGGGLFGGRSLRLLGLEPKADACTSTSRVPAEAILIGVAEMLRSSSECCFGRIESPHRASPGSSSSSRCRSSASSLT